MPYAEVIPLAEEHVLQEAHPAAFLSHLTALTLHGLTNLVPAALYATAPLRSQRLPLGTETADWEGIERSLPQQPPTVGVRAVRWTRISEWEDLGVEVMPIQGIDIYVADTERTLIDCLSAPAKAHGIQSALRAWKDAVPMWNLDRLLSYTETLGSPITRQRVGYLVESLGYEHPTLAAWKSRLQRGGSMKLVASEPYAPAFSPEWNLSLNVDPGILEEFTSRD